MRNTSSRSSTSSSWSSAANSARRSDMATEPARSSLRLLALLLIAAPALAQAAPHDPKYPARWFDPVPTAGAPSWEVLPQEAGEGEVILSKRNELGLLSNFAAT